ncbi:hypothetical protein TRV_04003 [Trichophyton verrucosum HKI 0517]|uniref:Uncharacterized protein n=1 Tax=Trichophyton verrucosum (strain HKI 0517) TaxID=663202 RepID=D4DA59_TRIVH|nr:uncharacterized protein TRV_04003 [Trichophyton verrucosum HKI 0517]EFE41210.1 hypothetical protein TRV_04003 [Trichophyton verrucosum HKI 0517]
MTAALRLLDCVFTTERVKEVSCIGVSTVLRLAGGFTAEAEVGKKGFKTGDGEEGGRLPERTKEKKDEKARVKTPQEKKKRRRKREKMKSRMTGQDEEMEMKIKKATFRRRKKQRKGVF